MRPAKRILDVVFAGMGLVILSPLFLVIALLVKLEDGGPVFFRSKRVSQNGGTFDMWKFRTMIPNASAVGGPLTLGDDPRVTRIGVILRKSKLDELPQLSNVLAGNMSLVGPRPEVPELAALYSPDQRRVFELVPGITCPASIAYINESVSLGAASNPEARYVDSILDEKIRITLDYAQRATVLTDLVVVLRTLVWLFRSE